jgi:hypothetical protein
MTPRGTKDMARVVQVVNGNARRVALVDEPVLRVLEGVKSTHAAASMAIATGESLTALVQRLATGPALDYDEVYDGRGPWRLLPPLDHPEEPARCIVSGTGLTHLGSARDRDAMHAATVNGTATHAADDEDVTDSIRMFRAGLQGGRPAPGEIGIAPEWFYKGVGTMLRAHGEALVVPRFAEGGGEEAEIAGGYVIAPDGTPYRVGLVAGNEFSDHRFERRNYLNLAGSKLRTSAIGPELVLSASFESVPGEVWIERDGARIWSRAIASGEAEMSHSLRNLEHHHFKFEAHRRPGDVHVHFFGAHSLSFGAGITLVDGDVVGIRYEGFGRALRNPIRLDAGRDRPVEVRPLG